MDIRFDGRVALVSGGAQGIGRAIGVAFRNAGASVHLVDRDESVRAAAQEAGMEAHVADLSDRKAATELVRKIAEVDGRLDVLALAAGGVCGLADLPLEGVTDENWDMVFDANVKSALWLSQAAAPLMSNAGWGRIVIVSSGAGLRPSLTGLHAYTSAKHAVIGLTKQLSVGLAKQGITANSIAPGLILSNPSTRKQWEGYGPEGQARVLASFNTGRLGTAEDIANAALFLASEQAGWITGQSCRSTADGAEAGALSGPAPGRAGGGMWARVMVVLRRHRGVEPARAQSDRKKCGPISSDIVRR
jgi:3-oxoacyl-[acyl-carrier protein] reductase